MKNEANESHIFIIWWLDRYFLNFERKIGAFLLVWDAETKHLIGCKRVIAAVYWLGNDEHNLIAHFYNILPTDGHSATHNKVWSKFQSELNLWYCWWLFVWYIAEPSLHNLATVFTLKMHDRVPSTDRLVQMLVCMMYWQISIWTSFIVFFIYIF